MLSPKGGAVQPLSLVRGLAAAATAAGARVFRQAPVTATRRTGDRWELTAANRRIRAEWVILATNGYTDGLLSGLKRSLLPLTPIQIATDPLPEDQIGPILPRGHTISDTRRLIMYARREPGGQMVFGGIGYRRPLGGTGGFAWLLRDAARVFPSLQQVSWSHRWSGQIALTADLVPHFHEPAPGLIAGLGYNGRGVAMSLVMGRGPGRAGAWRQQRGPAVPGFPDQGHPVPRHPGVRSRPGHGLVAPARRPGVATEKG